MFLSHGEERAFAGIQYAQIERPYWYGLRGNARKQGCSLQPGLSWDRVHSKNDLVLDGNWSVTINAGAMQALGKHAACNRTSVQYLLKVQNRQYSVVRLSGITGLEGKGAMDYLKEPRSLSPSDSTRCRANVERESRLTANVLHNFYSSRTSFWPSIHGLGVCLTMSASGCTESPHYNNHLPILCALNTFVMCLVCFSLNEFDLAACLCGIPFRKLQLGYSVWGGNQRTHFTKFIS